MALGISLFSVTGLTAAIVHLFNHAIIKTALFMALGCIIFRTGSVEYRVPGRHRPAHALDHGSLRLRRHELDRRAADRGLHQ